MKRLLPVIFFAGCPDPADDTMTPPAPVHDPTGPCVGFGLDFSGASFVDREYFGSSASWRGATGDQPKPIARGGVEGIYVSGERYLGAGVPEYEPAVNAPTLAVDATSPYQPAFVTGVAAGIGDLCIYDPGSTEVHDGTRLVVRDVDSIIATPGVHDYHGYEVPNVAYPFESWRMHTGPKRALGVALLSAEGWRLVDQKMQIRAAIGDGPLLSGLDESWDSITLDVDQPTTVRLQATLASGEVHEATVQFVDTIDRLVRRPSPTYADPTHLYVGGSWGWVCLDAFAGEANVIGAPFVFGTTPQVSIYMPQLYPNCVELQPLVAGDGALTVQVDDQVLEIPISVAPAPTGS